MSLRSSMMTFSGNEKTQGFAVYKMNNNTIMVLPANGGWLATDSVDLTGVHSLNIMCGWQEPPKKGMAFDVRLDAQDGKLLGSGSMGPGKKGQPMGMVHVPFQAINDGQFHNLYIIYKPMETVLGGIFSIQFNP